MATTKVYCDILDIFGINWSGIHPQQIDCIIQTVNSLELLGGEDKLFGFVGTAYLNDVIAGFFMIQFPTEILSYSIDKTANRETTKPAERVFFTLLPKYGKILIQNRRFEILPISMDAVYRSIYLALLAHGLLTCAILLFSLRQRQVSYIPNPIQWGSLHPLPPAKNWNPYIPGSIPIP
jgi:hypothetical protein